MTKRPSVLISVKIIVTIGLFLFAVRLLGDTTHALSPLLRRSFQRVIVGNVPALGISWLAAYMVASGTIVAALALSLFDSNLITPTQLFLMIVGSRLGSAAIIVFIGAFDYINEEVGSLRESVRLGLLTFLLTHSVYLPAMALGYVLISVAFPATSIDESIFPAGLRTPAVLSILTGGILESVGSGAAFVIAIAALLLSMRSFDRILKRVNKRKLRARYLSRLSDKWTSFGLGLVVTSLTTSVAFSLGVVVPLYNRGHINRNEIVPYILGANIGTLVDTLIIAIALNTSIGALIVVLLLATGLVVTVLCLLLFPTYSRFVDTLQDGVIESDGYVVGFLLSLLILPLLLVFL
ncbi:Na/Pi cotransporter family protein [Haladaptatus caseinilyticus]|uniref:sodium:phosphate symporter n=1 Tax=Haladaptatus caseinilyticus TaxID=2993314 RepID=UPI00224ABD4E|nr:sodium:phosphate symporter [Haladaptatus caseinilyticus]